ncbi:MAG: hypothetical protein P4L79_09420, partial [Legionella sp.]|uniref:hypothetical protein n=1 Tax=Legionella sp. TaxID=459 RepID=UPI00284EACEE|nr:hypothetical protein [Legionella sp.]
MKKLVLFCFMLLWGVCWAEEHQHERFSSCAPPWVNLTFPQGFPTTIYDGQVLRVPMQISIDETLTPQFRQDNPQLPLLIPGQPFAHDFVANRDVWPEYENMPYEISFAEDYTPPQWLKLENNKLFSVANVPMATKDIEVTLVIKNIPGGVSNPITLSLTVP